MEHSDKKAYPVMCSKRVVDDGAVHLQRASRKWSLCNQKEPGKMTTDWCSVTCKDCLRRINFERGK